MKSAHDRLRLNPKDLQTPLPPTGLARPRAYFARRIRFAGAGHPGGMPLPRIAHYPRRGCSRPRAHRAKNIGPGIWAHPATLVDQMTRALLAKKAGVNPQALSARMARPRPDAYPDSALDRRPKKSIRDHLHTIPKE